MHWRPREQYTRLRLSKRKRLRLREEVGQEDPMMLRELDRVMRGGGGGKLAVGTLVHE